MDRCNGVADDGMVGLYSFEMCLTSVWDVAASALCF